MGLENPDGGVRREAVSDLAFLKLPSTVPLLLRSMRDSNGDVRLEAARGLGQLDPPGLLPMLQGLLKDPDPNVVEAAENAISRYERTHSK